MPLQEAGAPRALLDRLESTSNETPTEDDFAAAVAALDALDKAGHRALRVEQSYLRKALFKGPTAPCDLCRRVFEVEFLVAAHIKKRADCDDQEKRDVAHVVMSACRFGCDELYERGYIAVGDDGQVIFSDAIEASEHARAYAVQHLKGKFFGQPMTGRAGYFTWHRENKFLGAV
jgi:predicted restriction endonuclease